MTAGDKGAPIIFRPMQVVNNALVPYQIPSGGSVTMSVQLQAQPYAEVAHVTYTMTVDSSGYFATYTTLGTEFPVGGVYNIQFTVYGPSNVTAFSTAILNESVNALITP